MITRLPCKLAQRYLAAFVDSELKDWLHRLVMKHIEKCDSCRKMVELQRRIKDLLRATAQQVKAPERLKMRIQKECSSEPD